MSLELMTHAIPVGDYQYHFNVDQADEALLKKAIIFDESYSEIYGHAIFDNLNEIKDALSK